jgi:hypothetical protein
MRRGISIGLLCCILPLYLAGYVAYRNLGPCMVLHLGDGKRMTLLLVVTQKPSDRVLYYLFLPCFAIERAYLSRNDDAA